MTWPLQGEKNRGDSVYWSDKTSSEPVEGYIGEDHGKLLRIRFYLFFFFFVLKRLPQEIIKSDSV